MHGIQLRRVCSHQRASLSSGVVHALRPRRQYPFAWSVDKDWWRPGAAW
jgi:hypothetical protein